MSEGQTYSYLNGHLTALKGKRSLWLNDFPACQSEQAACLHVETVNRKVTVGLKCTEG